MHRYKITLEYLGTGYCGWQKQKHSLSLQEVVENAIKIATKEHVDIYASGRTDSGVHAYGQVAHFDLEKYYEPRRLMESINHFIRPHTIGIIDIESVNNDFHARFSAHSRSYVYKILNRCSINIINKNLVHHIRDPLDINAMQQGANYLLGKHDFTSFRASECQASSSIRTINTIIVTQAKPHNIEIYYEAISFLHHMVRNITGSLIMVGRGKWPAIKMKELLEAKDRTKSGMKAPAYGLYFLGISYDR